MSWWLRRLMAAGAAAAEGGPRSTRCDAAVSGVVSSGGEGRRGQLGVGGAVAHLSQYSDPLLVASATDGAGGVEPHSDWLGGGGGGGEWWRRRRRWLRRTRHAAVLL